MFSIVTAPVPIPVMLAMTILNRLLALVVPAVCYGLAHAGSVLAHFPGPTNSLRAPNRLHSINNVDRDQEPNHSLLLRDEKTGLERKVLDYGRHVDVMWAPDSKSFFVNDYAGSTESNCQIFSAHDLKRLDVLETLKAADRARLPGGDHLYVACTAWHGESVGVSLSGRGDGHPEGIELKYSVNTRTGKAQKVR
jgi:hypothetical protein